MPAESAVSRDDPELDAAIKALNEDAQLVPLGAAEVENTPTTSPQTPRPMLASVPEEALITRVDDGVETTEYVTLDRPDGSEPPSPVSARNLSATMAKTPVRLSMEAKPVVLKINLSTSRMNLLNDDASLYASPVAFYEKLKEVSNTSELAGLVAQGDSQFHDDLRKLLLAEFDFTGMSVDESLRDLLETFELPKESQQIDRIVGAFAQKYHEDNSDVFENADSAHILTFSLLMLNTDLHSPHVKRKMTPTDFINNTRFGPAARSLPAELLEVLYENVASVEFRMGPTTGEPGAEATKRKNWGLGKTAKKLGLKKPERAGGKFGKNLSSPVDIFGVPAGDKNAGKDAKRTLQKMFSWATGGTLKRKMGWAMGGDIQSAESALDSIDHLIGLVHRPALPASQAGQSQISAQTSQAWDITGGILAATSLSTNSFIPPPDTTGANGNINEVDNDLKRTSVSMTAPPSTDARTSESSSTFINSNRSSSSLHRPSLSSTLGRFSGSLRRPSLSMSSRSSIFGSRPGSLASQAQSASYAQPPASMMDPSTVLLHARLNVRKVHHSATSSSRPPGTPIDGLSSGVMITSASNASLSSNMSGNDGASTAADDFGAWPLTWVALKNDGTITLYNPATRKTTVLPVEGAVAVWDPWFYRPMFEELEGGAEPADNVEVPKDAPGCWHLWLPSPPYQKDYIFKGDHAGEWVGAINGATTSAFFSTPASAKVTVDQLSALVRIQNDKLASLRHVLNHLSVIRPLSSKAKKKIQDIVGRKWQEAREAKRDRERYAALLSDLERRAGSAGGTLKVPTKMSIPSDSDQIPASGAGTSRFGTI